jgi:hypothetical protein
MLSYQEDLSDRASAQLELSWLTIFEDVATPNV